MNLISMYTMPDIIQIGLPIYKKNVLYLNINY